MKLRCHLKTIRGERPLREISRAAGVNAGELSRIENGTALPKDRDVAALELAYSAELEDWYPPRVLLSMEADDDALHAVRVRLRTTLIPRED